MVKRVGNLYSKVYDMDNLRLAHERAKKGKGWYKEVREVDKNPEKHLKAIQTMLVNKTYKTSKYIVFKLNDSGKEREIYKLPYYPDRIVQWALMLVIEPYLVNTFTKDTYSAIPKRGVHLALKRMRKAISDDPDECRYTLKLDVKKYYPSIDHDILKQKYRRKFKDPNVIWLLDEIIDSTEPDEGVPIGNYVSQYSGNFYLSKFDHWIKEDKRIKYYFRYMDDIVIFGSNKQELHELFKEIKVVLWNELRLTIKGNYQVFPTYVRGVDFVGYRVFKDYTLLRKSIVKSYKKKMLQIKAKGDNISYSDWCSINSYKGWLLYCNSHRLYEKYTKPLEEVSQKFYETYVKGAS